MRLIARYARELADTYEIVTVWDEKTQREQTSKTDPHIATLSRRHPAAIWFERKMHDDFGIVIDDAFDNRPMVHQERFPKGVHPMQKSFHENSIEEADYMPYKYEAIGGDGVFEVAVGPIHAGIIEPGHFQFSQAGEDILHQEVRHFYKYRAIEKMLEGKTLEEAKPVIERISGNESIAYQSAWRDIVLEATGTQLPEANRRYHALLLEMERLIHHLTDLGFIPNDAGFGAALAFASRLAEEARRMLRTLCGHRFGFGAIDFEAHTLVREVFLAYLEALEKEVAFFEAWILDIPSLWDRFDTTGILKKEKAVKYDTVGVVARASGLGLDCRNNDFYRAHGFQMQIQQSADVSARFMVRLKEVQNSITMMRHFSMDRCEGVTPGSAKDGTYEAFVESSLGELYMSVTLQNGVIDRFFVRDPSFMNWQALHLMMPNNIIADFPLINKSCDLSYAGNDL
ncbi:NADH-quinone oxidoreductase subunit C [Sulfurovum sp.]|uniref:hydrogenase large subunit n=2 Tax=Sulfurovum sp. TaxID=1969726 RepID=UPI0025F66B82|nr:NADH-quinone oxidoreductase subunit C [Sulfurovum sp.]